MSRPKPPPPSEPTLEQALAWPGPGREATTAHPDCTCTTCRHRPGYRCGPGWACSLARPLCPMHGPEAKT